MLLPQASGHSGEFARLACLSLKRAQDTRSNEDRLKVAKDRYEQKLRDATNPAERAEAKEDYEHLVKELSTIKKAQAGGGAGVGSNAASGEVENEGGLVEGSWQPKPSVNVVSIKEDKDKKKAALELQCAETEMAETVEAK